MCFSMIDQLTDIFYALKFTYNYINYINDCNTFVIYFNFLRHYRTRGKNHINQPFTNSSLMRSKFPSIMS